MLVALAISHLLMPTALTLQESIGKLEQSNKVHIIMKTKNLTIH
jgi:hypothetical protein